uniref:Septin-7 n=1 Tax=Lates calcarifer TaxID=8187 RepID=A0A4W6D165_LATCA
DQLTLSDRLYSLIPGPSHRIKKTVQVIFFLQENWQPVIDYIDSKFEDYLNAESRVNRRQMPDNRVHCCLYFITETLDIEFMKRLHEKVNECQQFKKQIMKEIQEHKIKIYDFPETDDEEEMRMVRKIKDRLPLAVVGSNTIIEVNGKHVRGRQYPWGVAEVENGEHCDFTILRNMLIRTHMQDLKDVTNNVHYENYRSKKLAAVTYNNVDNNKNKGQLTTTPHPHKLMHSLLQHAKCLCICLFLDLRRLTACKFHFFITSAKSVFLLLSLTIPFSLPFFFYLQHFEIYTI